MSKDFGGGAFRLAADADELAESAVLGTALDGDVRLREAARA
ncbi:hypothetical protein [Sinomonas terrae]|nr:hypothetical protein [Sinomonas terrae]